MALYESALRTREDVRWLCCGRCMHAIHAFTSCSACGTRSCMPLFLPPGSRVLGQHKLSTPDRVVDEHRASNPIWPDDFHRVLQVTLRHCAIAQRLLELQICRCPSETQTGLHRNVMTPLCYRRCVANITWVAARQRPLPQSHVAHGGSCGGSLIFCLSFLSFSLPLLVEPQPVHVRLMLQFAHQDQ